MNYLTTPLLVICLMFSSFAIAQKSNPNNLPPCPQIDSSKFIHFGVGGRTEKWNNCWGRYVVELNDVHKGDVLEGEWLNGLPHGQGTYTHANDDKYVGEFRYGKKHGHGAFYYLANNQFKGYKYIGEFKDDHRNGQGIGTTADGKRFEGIWESDKFIRVAKVNLPIQNNNVTTNTDRSDIDRERQQLAEDRKLLESNPNKLPPCKGTDTTKWSNCFGSESIPKGHNYTGDFLNGKKHGYGVMDVTFETNRGDKYVGEFKEGIKNGQGTYIFANGEKYVGEHKDGMPHGKGTASFTDGNKYVGELKEKKFHGYGTFTFANGNKYVGEFKDNMYNGSGILTTANGERKEGIWENNKFIREAKVNLPNQNNNTATNTDRSDIDRERQQLAEERRQLDDEKRQRQQASSSQRINLQINHTQPNNDGLFFIDIKTNADTASLLIDGKEEGGKSDGNYTLKRIARAGQSSSFKIVATDIYGNTDTKTINVTRTISEAKATYADLNPTNIKRKSDRDAVAIIIGISDYKNLPKADFANDDARVFYDYALRALSVKPENIKLLVDSDASEVGIYKAFKTWLPSKVRSSTDVYVFYSGHGLPTSDGKGLYLLPQQTDRDLISKTAIQMQEVISDIQSTKPKSVTLFLDACYSGQSRTGETLIASARPISIRSESRIFPENFTVITASQNDQISSSNPDLKHGIFSYYLMRGMEGDADTDKDGKITLGEMQSYLIENVGRQAGMMNRKQEPQLIGDANRVLVGR